MVLPNVPVRRSRSRRFRGRGHARRGGAGLSPDHHFRQAFLDHRSHRHWAVLSSPSSITATTEPPIGATHGVGLDLLARCRSVKIEASPHDELAFVCPTQSHVASCASAFARPGKSDTVHLAIDRLPGRRPALTDPGISLPQDLPGVERVAQPVADVVDGEDGEEDRRPGEDRPVGREVEVVLGVEEEPAPRRDVGREAEAEE